MAELLLHSKTRNDLEAFIMQPSHALLIYGLPGVGKNTVAQYLAANMLNLSLNNLNDHPYVRIIDAAADKSIAIETVRGLEHFLSLKVPSNANVTRIVIIGDAHLLSAEAQNALLKTVEEPPSGTVLILTAPNPSDVLQTVRSRVQQLAVLAPLKTDTENYFELQGHDNKSVNQAAAMTGGLPGLMTALLEDKAHPLQPAVDAARVLLQQSVYERLLSVDSLTKQKEHTLAILYMLGQMSHSRLQTTEGPQFKRWQSILTASYAAAEQLKANGQPKLVLDTLMLNLK